MRVLLLNLSSYEIMLSFVETREWDRDFSTFRITASPFFFFFAQTSLIRFPLLQTKRLLIKRQVSRWSKAANVPSSRNICGWMNERCCTPKAGNNVGFLVSARHEGGPPSSLTSYFADSHSASDKGKVADSALTKGEENSVFGKSWVQRCESGFHPPFHYRVTKCPLINHSILGFSYYNVVLQ